MMVTKPPIKRRYGKLIFVLAMVLLLIVAPALAWLFTDWLWYRDLGRESIYWTFTWGQWLPGIIVGLVAFLIISINIYLAIRGAGEAVWANFGRRLRERMMMVVDRSVRRFVIWAGIIISALFAFGVGSSAAANWQQILLFFHAQKVGEVDPIFGRDLGFYMFRLPVWELLVRWTSSALMITLILVAIIYLLTRTVRSLRGFPVFAAPVAMHLSWLLGLIFLTRIAAYYLYRFDTLYREGNNFVGVGYTEAYARIPALNIMIGVAAICALLMLINMWRRTIYLPVVAVALILVVGALAQGVYPAMVQRFQVEPNELALETPFIANHISFTRKAFGLDNVEEVQFPPRGKVTADDVAGAPVTMKNLRLWDYRPLQQVYNQRQVIRTYYQIHDVDVDRYVLDGELRQVMIAAREMNVDSLSGDQGWVNRHLIYTHGYGVVMSPVNEVQGNGEPNFFISNIPPQSTYESLKINRPELYFSEMDTDYALTNTTQQEFDYPTSGDNSYSTYMGNGGISMVNPLVRYAMALRFSDVNLLISKYITPQSRILFRRSVSERVAAAAPFLAFDKDPYIVIGTDGKLYWIIDGYTRSSRYPYARSAALGVAGGEPENVNYVRNSVKAVVDAYNGETKFYLTDTNEPVINAWAQVFPDMFHPLAEMPAGLRAHVRLPEGLFNAQYDVYRRYHMKDPRLFYSQEDLWDVPFENASGDNGTLSAQPMEAYYVIMSLPGKNEPEYLLTHPYVPASSQQRKTNMIAWLSARNEPDQLGKLVVYNFPKQSQIDGPEQIYARIQQDPVISPELTLWNQQGSRVVLGNMLVIPVADSLLYVQPLYLQANKSQIPELQRVIVADKEGIAMRPTLGEALAALTGIKVTAKPAPNALPATATPVTPAQLTLARSAMDHYSKAQIALKAGDWATYGAEQEALRKDLEELNR